LNFLRKITHFIFKFLTVLLFPLDKNLITVFFHGYSGSNVLPILEKIQEVGLYGFKLKVIDFPEKSFKEVKKKLEFKWELYKWIARSKIIVATEGSIKLRKRTIIVELWHGFPTKKSGLMGKTFLNNSIPDIYCSYSDFGSVLRNACLGITGNRYVITGAPRNDYLFDEKGKENLEKILSINLSGNNIVIYAPTWQFKFYSFPPEEFSFKNLFGFDEFNFESFLDFLERNKTFFLIKLHPKVEDKIINLIKAVECERIKVLFSNFLRDKKTDFYKVLNAADVLITDYSSIYFDWLLLDRPVIFVPVKIDEYRKERGWLFEPYELWTAGPKCFDQHSLEVEIEKCLKDSDYFRRERQWILNIVHHYKDGHSKDRVINLLKRLMKEA